MQLRENLWKQKIGKKETNGGSSNGGSSIFHLMWKEISDPNTQFMIKGECV